MQQTTFARAPLTFGQLSLWRSIQHIPPTACNLPQVWSLPTGTAAADVARAWGALVERHESLRTRYEPGADGGLVQVVHPAQPGPLDLVAARGDAEADAHEVAAELARAPFDLGSDRPWRAVVVAVDGQPTHLALCLHHIAVDAWALSQLRLELLGLLRGSPPSGDAPTCRELAEEQWSPGRENRRRAARRFWQGVLEAAPPMERTTASDGGTPLTTRWARFASVRARRSAQLLAERLEVSAPSVVLGAFCLAVHRRSGADRVLVGVYTNNRTDPRWEGLVAAQNQVVPLLVRFAPDDDLATVAHRVHWDLLRSYRHGAYDVDDVLALGREHGYTGSVNGSFDGSVSGFFRYFFNYLGEFREEQTTADEEISTGDAGRNIGAPLYLQAQDGTALTCTLRENAPVAGQEELVGLLASVRDLVVEAAGPR